MERNILCSDGCHVERAYCEGWSVDRTVHSCTREQVSQGNGRVQSPQKRYKCVGCDGHQQEKSVVWSIADVASGTSHDVGSDGYVFQLPEMGERNYAELVLLPEGLSVM